jgi:hypothetical protein
MHDRRPGRFYIVWNVCVPNKFRESGDVEVEEARGLEGAWGLLDFGYDGDPHGAELRGEEGRMN